MHTTHENGASRFRIKEFSDLMAGITTTSAQKNRSVKSARHAQKDAQQNTGKRKKFR